MAEITLDIYCGICGTACCGSTDFDYRYSSVRITIECPECQKHINNLEKQVGDLEDEVFELQKEKA